MAKPLEFRLTERLYRKRLEQEAGGGGGEALPDNLRVSGPGSAGLGKIDPNHHKSKEYLYHAMAAGAEGYLLKEDADIELIKVLEAIQAGKSYISPLLSPELTELLVLRMREGLTQHAIDPLTKLEKQVLKLIAEGKASQQIADLLYLSVRTVHRHRANILKKLNLKKSIEVVKNANSKGYTSLSD